MADPPVGKTWSSHRYEVGLEKIREYASAVGEESPVYHDRAAARQAGFVSPPAPPVFTAVFCAPAVGAVMFDPEVGLFDPSAGIGSYRFVHKEQHFEWSRPVLAGDVVTTAVQLAAAEELDDGRALRVFESVSVDDEGRHLVTARYEGVVPPLERKPRPPSAEDEQLSGSPVVDVTDPRPGELLCELEFTPDRYAPIRYAGASGDFTPFHLDDGLARSMGLDGAILHGLYSFAQLARGHTAPFGGDPRTLQSLNGRFRRPAYPGQASRVRVAVAAAAGDGTVTTSAEMRQGESAVITSASGGLRLPATTMPGARAI